MFPFLVTTLLFIVIGSLVLPFFRKTDFSLIEGQAASLDEEQVNLQIERRTIAASLSELEIDFEQGRIASSDYDQMKLGFEHRLLEILDRLGVLDKTAAAQEKSSQKEAASPSTATGKNWMAMLLLVVVVGGGATEATNLFYGNWSAWRSLRKRTACRQAHRLIRKRWWRGWKND